MPTFKIDATTTAHQIYSTDVDDLIQSLNSIGVSTFNRTRYEIEELAKDAARTARLRLFDSIAFMQNAFQSDYLPE